MPCAPPSSHPSVWSPAVLLLLSTPTWHVRPCCPPAAAAGEGVAVSGGGCGPARACPRAWARGLENSGSACESPQLGGRWELEGVRLRNEVTPGRGEPRGGRSTQRVCVRVRVWVCVCSFDTRSSSVSLVLVHLHPHGQTCPQLEQVQWAFSEPWTLSLLF